MIKELQPIRKNGNDLAVIAPDEYAVLWRMSIESKINEIVKEVNEQHKWLTNPSCVIPKPEI